MGEMIRICYEDTAYYDIMCKVEDNLQQNVSLKQRNIDAVQAMNEVVSTLNSQNKQLLIFAK